MAPQKAGKKDLAQLALWCTNVLQSRGLCSCRKRSRRQRCLRPHLNQRRRSAHRRVMIATCRNVGGKTVNYIGPEHLCAQCFPLFLHLGLSSPVGRKVTKPRKAWFYGINNHAP